MHYEIMTDVGQKRTLNEDAAAVYLSPEGVVLALLADGMGGHKGGDFASTTAVRLFGDRFDELQSADWSLEDWQEWLRETVYAINRILFDYGESNEAFKGMGTTLEVVLVIGKTYLISHIGDSRIYTITADEVKQLTTDHSYVNVLVKNGEITADEAVTHPQRNLIMKALGSERTIDPDFSQHQLTNESYLLLCTDGLTNELSLTEIQTILQMDEPLQKKAYTLIQQANDKGGEDNITVVLLQPSHQGVSE